ncbi:hypothetical protein E2C01_006881 [Portunus trituberculatus]|uniref:Uncharacterized protein n=1 Tax=Portunus trituberculatus TaxID=210409 RepID=A0A5B7CXH6_PORTR|nr:hypothetical protein [Portunus trituberculatus]
MSWGELPRLNRLRATFGTTTLEFSGSTGSKSHSFYKIMIGPKLGSVCPVSLSTFIKFVLHLTDTHCTHHLSTQFVPLESVRRSRLTQLGAQGGTV